MWRELDPERRRTFEDAYAQAMAAYKAALAGDGDKPADEAVAHVEDEAAARVAVPAEEEAAAVAYHSDADEMIE